MDGTEAMRQAVGSGRVSRNSETPRDTGLAASLSSPLDELLQSASSTRDAQQLVGRLLGTFPSTSEPSDFSAIAHPNPEVFSRTPGSKRAKPSIAQEPSLSKTFTGPPSLQANQLRTNSYINNSVNNFSSTPGYRSHNNPSSLHPNTIDINHNQKLANLLSQELSSTPTSGSIDVRRQLQAVRYTPDLLQQSNFNCPTSQQLQAALLQHTLEPRSALPSPVCTPPGFDTLSSYMHRQNFFPPQQSSLDCIPGKDWNNKSYNMPGTPRPFSCGISTPISPIVNSDQPKSNTSAFQPIGNNNDGGHSWHILGNNQTHGLSRESTPSPCSRTVDQRRGPPIRYHPDNTKGFPPNNNNGPGVALSVTNLDYNISGREWRKILHSAFQQYVQVLNVLVHHQPDGTNMGIVYVPSKEEARYAIMQCHRRKIGYKRIYVSLLSNDLSNQSHRVRSEVISVLSDVTGGILPLFKFIENYEKRFHRSISVSELYHMKDTVEIKEHVGKGRMVCLHSNANTTPCNKESGDESPVELHEQLFCELHCSQSEFTLLEESGMLPYVKLELVKFVKNVHTLLQLHDGVLPLMSFGHCYAAAFSTIPSATEGGVPLEHLITCVSGVQVKVTRSGMKKVMWLDNRPSSPASSILSEASSNDSYTSRSGPSLNQKLSQFSREVVDLLKRMPGCQMSFSKFIPSYHHHFGRQCRVADYGYSKLIELFEAVPHVLQVLGTGGQRILYLTHRIHLRRFTADLLRVLKAQPEKSCTVKEFPNLYSEVIGHDLLLNTFGVCYIQDMLNEISESQLLVTGSGDSITICIPRKDQTPDEIERTKQFAHEVIDLLKNCPQCTMVFNKFIPAYHHHFGRQCRVSDYGFTKLVELFEAIPDVVNMVENSEERYISLTQNELFKVITEQMVSLLKASPGGAIETEDFCQVYQKHFGHNIHIEDFGVDNVVDLVDKVSNIAMIETRAGKHYIVMRNRSNVQYIAQKCFELLMERSNGEMRLSKFIERYKHHYCEHVDLVTVKHEMYPAIEIKEDQQCGVISLHPLLDVARRVKSLLTGNQGKLTLLNFELAYRQNYGMSLTCQQYGFPGVTVMLQVMDFMVSIRGRGARQTILLRQDYLCRLAHQVVYKIGIFTELTKHKQNTDISVSKDAKRSAGSDSGILDDSALIKNESILTCSPDLLPTAGAASTSCASSHPVHSSQGAMSDISYDLPSPGCIFENLSLETQERGSGDSLFGASHYLPSCKRMQSPSSSSQTGNGSFSSSMQLRRCAAKFLTDGDHIRQGF